MPTISDSLGSPLPFPSTPPKTIFPSSDNEDVKLWVYHVLKRNQNRLTNDDAWALADKVNGTGQTALRYSEEHWEKQVPGWGPTIYLELNQPDKYVIDTVFEILLVIQVLLLFFAGGSGIYQIIKKSDLELTKIIGLVFVTYTFSLRIIQAILSSQWAHQWKGYPEKLKLRRTENNSFWKDFAGIPK